MSEYHDIEDEKDVIQKTFLKIESNMGKEGYREGIEKGKQKVYQQYFDRGYIDGFRNGYRLGKVKGTSLAKFTFNNTTQSKCDVLEKSSTGACILCKEENLLYKPISHICSKQAIVLDNLLNNIDNKQE